MTKQIIDNFLEFNDFQRIKDTMFSNKIYWYYANGVVPEDTALCKPNFNTQMYHPFYSDEAGASDTFEVLNPIIKKLNFKRLIKCKANLLLCTETPQIHGFHMDLCDYPDIISQSKTAVFYVNTNNGSTVFEKYGKRVTSVENRIAIFDATEIHSGSTCTDQKSRIVININYIP
jgi:hypothetical protein